MKIGIITDETDTQLSGLGTYTYNIVKNILQQDKKNEYFLIHRRKEEHDIYSMAKEIILPSGMFPLSTLRNFVTLPLKLKKYDLDIVHHPSSIGPFAIKHFWPTKGKTIQTIHDIIPLLDPKSFELPVRLAFKHLLPRIVRNVDKIFAVSEHVKKDISSNFKIPMSKIGVTYDGVSGIYKPINAKKSMGAVAKYGIKSNFVLYVSTLEAKKNVPTLLRAFHILKKSGMQQKLVLVGKQGHGYNEILATIKKLNLESEVIMPGYVPLEDLPMFYNAADVFVLPSLYEGFGIPAVEAMKCGCPVVASKGGSLPEVVGDAGKLVDVMDVDGYAAAIKEVVESKNTAASLRRKGLRNAERFSWEKSAKTLIDEYTSS